MFKRVSSLLCCSMLFSFTVDARPLADEPGWSATINLNVGYVSGKNQFSTDDDNQITDDLNNNGKSTSSAIAYPLLRVDYTTQDLKNQFFLGNSRENLGRAQFQYELGYTRVISERSKVTAAYFPELPLLNDTWSDPYLTGQARQKTDENYQGGRLRFESIADSPLTLEYVYANRTVDNEQSGVSISDLSQSDIESLKRDADLHRLIAETFVPLSRKWFLAPAVAYTTAKADGSANDFDQYTLRITSIYRSGPHVFTLNTEYGQTKFSGSNPVFNNQTQKDDKLSVFGIYVFNEPFGWKNTMFNLLGGYNDTDSNINFYDSKGGIAALGFGYKFK